MLLHLGNLSFLLGVLHGCPLSKRYKIDKTRLPYRNSKGILLILEKIVVADQYG